MLAKNETLIELTDRLSNITPNWEEIVDRFKETDLFKRKNYDISNLSGTLSEIHLRVALEQICVPYENRVIFDPINPDTSTTNYYFRRHNHQLVIINKSDGNIYSELDEILSVDDIPVLFETKIKSYRGEGGSSVGRKGSRRGKHLPVKRRKRIGDRKTHPGSLGALHAMRKERIDYLLDPIKEYFGRTNVGYALIISRDQIFPNSQPQQDFIESGGILVPFYTDRKTYRREVFKTMVMYNL